MFIKMPTSEIELNVLMNDLIRYRANNLDTYNPEHAHDLKLSEFNQGNAVYLVFLYLIEAGIR